MKSFSWQQIMVGANGSLCWLEACLGFCLLLLFVEDDADDVSLVLLHVFHQSLFACGFEATDTAAEQEHAVFHGGAWSGGLARVWLRLKLHRVLTLGV